MGPGQNFGPESHWVIFLLLGSGRVSQLWAESTAICKRVTPEEWAKHQKLPKLWEMNNLNHCSLFCKQHFLLIKGGGVLENSLMDLKWSKGIRPCKTDWRAWRKSLNLGWIGNWMTMQSEFWWRNHFLTIWKFDNF